MSWMIWGWSDPGSCAQPSVLADWSGNPLVDDSNADGAHAYVRSLGYSQGDLIRDALAAYDQCGGVPSTTNILALGDSITYGVNLPLSQSYPGDVGAALGSSFFVMNAGMPGDTIAPSIQKLPPKQRLVMELRLYHQMSFEEIAAVAGISTDGAKMNFHHGLKRLRTDAPEE